MEEVAEVSLQKEGLVCDPPTHVHVTLVAKAPPLSYLLMYQGMNGWEKVVCFCEL